MFAERIIAYMPVASDLSAKTKKTIGIFTTIQGHKSIAEAIHETLVDEYNVVVFTETDILFKVYGIFYKYSPFLWSGPFVAGSNRYALTAARKIFFERYSKDVTKFDQDNKIDLFINTFWMYESVLEKISQDTTRPLINILADPRSFHPTSIGLPPAVNVAFDQQALERCQEFYPTSQGLVMGWFVRQAFEAKYQPSKVKTELKLPLNQPIVLCVTGSEGMEKVLRIVNHLKVSRPATLVVACGHNQDLYQKIRRLSAKLLTTQPHLQLIPLPFTTEIVKYMQAADLVVGKAGPNMMFESIATLTPFMATSHVAGQEDGNLDIIRQNNLGYVEENATKAATLLSKILAEPQQLQKFQPTLQKMAAYNKNAKKSLLDFVEQQLT